jgi:osmotically-inducible protein OsmY
VANQQGERCGGRRRLRIPLQTKVKLALVDQMGTDGFRIDTDVASGVVSLAFEKDFTAARRQEAAKIAKGVEGVTKVVSVENK